MARKAEELINQEYKYGFITDIESDTVPPGLNEDIVRMISERKKEPSFMLEWRLNAYRRWKAMKEPKWSNVHYPPIDYDKMIYYAAPKPKKQLASLDEQHLGTFGGLPALDVQFASGQRLVAQFAEGLEAGFLRCRGRFARYGGLGGLAGHVLFHWFAGARQGGGAFIAARQAEAGSQQQAEQAVAQGFAITHLGLPRAEHGRRSGASG